MRAHQHGHLHRRGSSNYSGISPTAWALKAKLPPGGDHHLFPSTTCFTAAMADDRRDTGQRRPDLQSRDGGTLDDVNETPESLAQLMGDRLALERQARHLCGQGSCLSSSLVEEADLHHPVYRSAAFTRSHLSADLDLDSGLSPPRRMSRRSPLDRDASASHDEFDDDEFDDDRPVYRSCSIMNFEPIEGHESHDGLRPYSSNYSKSGLLSLASLGQPPDVDCGDQHGVQEVKGHSASGVSGWPAMDFEGSGAQVPAACVPLATARSSFSDLPIDVCNAIFSHLPASPGW